MGDYGAAINVIIVLYVLYAASWSLSYNCCFKNFVHKYLGKYVVYWGLWHSWNMFSGPSMSNDSLDVEIFFEDNTSIKINLFVIQNKKMFMGKRAGVRDVKFAEILIYNTEFSDFTRLSFAKYLVKNLKLDKKPNRITYIKNIETIPVWMGDGSKNNRTEILQTIPV
jgi:hypothetical protein